MFSFVSVSVSAEPGEGRGAHLKKGQGITNGRGPWKPLFLPHLPRRLGGGEGKQWKMPREMGTVPCIILAASRGSFLFPPVFPSLLYICESSQVALMAKTLPANAGDTRDVGLIPGSGRSPGVGSGNPLQYSCLENPMDRGTWWDTVHGVAKEPTPLGTHTLYIYSTLTPTDLNLDPSP